MRYPLILNIIFFALFIIFITLSFMINYFFFIPIICFLPFSFRSKYKSTITHEEIKAEENFSTKDKKSEFKLRNCPYCGMYVLDPVAKYCSQCGKKLEIK